MPDEIIHRHPFPGPGLAIRCIGDITQERLEILRKADTIVLEEIKKRASTAPCGRPLQYSYP